MLENKTTNIESLIFNQTTEDKYILDEENAIIVVENNDKETHPEYL